MALVKEANPSRVTTLWRSSIGKKSVMAVTGFLMLLFLLVHMLGNLKIFFGAEDFNSYADFLRRIGEPVLHYSWYLWVQRVVLVVALVLHIVTAYQLSRRDLRARPTKYAHKGRARASYATSTMRYGGVILGLFIIWHILDLTVGVLNPDYRAHHPYQNVVADFGVWYVDIIYIVAMIALLLHIYHGFWSAAQTLGANRPNRDRALKVTARVLAVVIGVGFLIVPVSVMTGLVS